MGENTVATLFQTIIDSNDHCVDIFTDNISAVYAHPKCDIIEFCTGLNEQKLKLLRSKLYEKFRYLLPCSFYSEGHSLRTRKKKLTLAEDIYVLGNSCNKYTKYPCYPRAKWENKTFINSYSANLTKRLSQIPVTDIRDVDQSNAVETVNRLCDDITSSIHEAVQDSCDSTSSYNNKIYSSSSGTKRSWWSTECKTARDRNRLYFYIWKTAGRPSCGQIYECYKYARKSYRKVCRLSVKKQEQKRLNGLDELCKSGRSKQLWNKIRK